MCFVIALLKNVCVFFFQSSLSYLWRKRSFNIIVYFHTLLPLVLQYSDPDSVLWVYSISWLRFLLEFVYIQNNFLCFFSFILSVFSAGFVHFLTLFTFVMSISIPRLCILCSCLFPDSLFCVLVNFRSLHFCGLVYFRTVCSVVLSDFLFFDIFYFRTLFSVALSILRLCFKSWFISGLIGHSLTLYSVILSTFRLC